MDKSRFTDPFDLDITLEDASVDVENAPTRRAIAALSIHCPVEDAYYSVREVRDSVAEVHAGEPGGKAKLARLLANACDDYQRAIYYALAGRGVVAMLDDLEWLETLLRVRGRVAREAAAAKVRLRDPLPPYVAAEPDGRCPPPIPATRWAHRGALADRSRQADLELDLALGPFAAV